MPCCTTRRAGYRESFTTTLGTDPWDALHRACEWIVTGQL